MQNQLDRTRPQCGIRAMEGAVTSPSGTRRPPVPRKAIAPRIIPLRHGQDPRFDERARCGLRASRLFDEKVPGEAQAAYRRRVAEARVVCAGCPVRADCLQHGRDNNLSGFMGGCELRKGRVIQSAGARSA